MIHPTAIVHDGADIGPGVEIGPYCVVGPKVTLAGGVRLVSHVVIEGLTRIGQQTVVHPFAYLGGPPQHLAHRGEETSLEVGERNTIREYCTLNRGTVQDAGVTRVGDDNWIMAYCHVAHDCQVGSHTVFANHATLAGHVHIGDYTILGGFVGVHQFVKVGAHVMAGISSVVTQDVPPYLTIAGNPCVPHGINSEGLKRRGFSPESLAALKRAYRTLYKSGLSLAQAREELERQGAEIPEIASLARFLAASTRGILR